MDFRDYDQTLRTSMRLLCLCIVFIAGCAHQIPATKERLPQQPISEAENLRFSQTRFDFTGSTNCFSQTRFDSTGSTNWFSQTRFDFTGSTNWKGQIIYLEQPEFDRGLRLEQKFRHLPPGYRP